MIFECADCTFGSVAAVVVQREKLEVNVIFVEGFLYCVGVLVVEDVESGGWTMLALVFVACLPVCSDLQGLPVF